MNSTVHVRVKSSTKKSAQKVLDELGLDMSTAIKLYLKQIALTRSIPFPLLTENGFTVQQEAEILQASEEAKQGINVSGPFETIEELKAHLNDSRDDHQDPQEI